MTTWTTPKTWVALEALTAAELNEQLRDNMNFLFDRPNKEYTFNTSDFTTTSSTFVDVSTLTNLTQTFGGNHVLCSARLSCYGSLNNSNLWFDVDIDGTRIGGDDGIAQLKQSPASTEHIVGFSVLVPSSLVAAGSHTFKLQWKVGAGTATIIGGAGPPLRRSFGQFWVHEL